MTTSTHGARLRNVATGETREIAFVARSDQMAQIEDDVSAQHKRPGERLVSVWRLADSANTAPAPPREPSAAQLRRPVYRIRG